MTTDVEAFLATSLTAIINTGSGGNDDSTAARMTEILFQAGLSRARVVSVPPTEIEAALRRAAAQAEVVVVLGGDGTIRVAAAQCSTAGKLLAPLPGGTMNMLPHALYGARPWFDILPDILAAPAVRNVSGGRVGGQPFYCAAVLGAPSLWADVREALRRADLVEAMKCTATAMRRRTGEPLTYKLGDQLSGAAEAIAVICPLVSRAMDENELSLEAAAIEPVAAAALFRLAFHAIFDDWRDDPSVCLAKVKHIEVNAHGRLPAILDGERVQLTRSVQVDFVPLAFRALVPMGRV